MKRKHFLKLAGLILLCVITLFGCSNSASNSSSKEGDASSKEKEETIKLKVATLVPLNHDQADNLVEPWMEKVTERTKGRVQFEYYPAEQLGKALDLLDLTRNGTTDITAIPANYYPSNMPLSNMLAGMPGLHETPYQGKMAYLDLVRENKELVETDFKKNGVRFLGTHITSTYSTFTKDKEIRVPKELKGLKFRSPGGVQSEMLQFAGATPVSITFSEIYESLERKIVDAIIYYNFGLKSAGINEVINKGVNTRLGSSLSALIINENTFQKLPKDIQEVMLEVGQEVTAEDGKALNKLEKESIDEMTKSGLFSELTESEQQKWDQFYEDFQETWLKENADKGLPYKEILEEYKEYLEKHKEK